MSPGNIVAVIILIVGVFVIVLPFIPPIASQMKKKPHHEGYHGGNVLEDKKNTAVVTSSPGPNPSPSPSPSPSPTTCWSSCTGSNPFQTNVGIAPGSTTSFQCTNLAANTNCANPQFIVPVCQQYIPGQQAGQNYYANACAQGYACVMRNPTNYSTACNCVGGTDCPFLPPNSYNGPYLAGYQAGIQALS